MTQHERDYAESYVDDPARCTSCGLRLHTSAPLCRECAEEAARVVWGRWKERRKGSPIPDGECFECGLPAPDGRFCRACRAADIPIEGLSK